MLPDPVWSALRKSRVWSIWFVRRTGWVVGVTMALVMLPIVTEQQRLEVEEMQNMQKRQVSVKLWRQWCCKSVNCSLTGPKIYQAGTVFALINYMLLVALSQDHLKDIRSKVSIA